MLTEEQLEERRSLIASGDLAALLARQVERARPVIARMPSIPDVKAALTSAGGVCPACGGALRFDPWSPDRHRCAKCGQTTEDSREHAHWARAQHLWIAERAAHLATVGVLTDDERAASRARELIAGYRDRYFELPNRDNVLGPTHLFFSTYLESMWIVSLLAGARALQARGWLPDDEAETVNAIADEAANLIGEFNEGLSNRQTWNAAALTAIGVWFGDAELTRAAIESQYGLLGHLTDGFADDGMWYEGENYHLFAMRGLLLGLDWARSGGIDLANNDELAAHLGDALMAPSLTALPDLTFPARHDARFGVSLAHPAYLECWEAGLATLGDAAPDELVPWLRALYAAPNRSSGTYDAYLHEAGEPGRERTTRADLSWWMLLRMTPELPPDTIPWRPASALLPSQGVAVLRQDGRYLSLECGGSAGGHGHPDQLHLTLHERGVHWLADPGAGSYVAQDLFWYRSTLAHNAPRLDGRSQVDREARCRAFDVGGSLSWMQARWDRVTRSVVSASDWTLDVVDLAQGVEVMLELPWHLIGDPRVVSPGRWVPDTLADDQVTGGERFESETAPIRIEAAAGDETASLSLTGGTLLRAECPGRPGEPPMPMLLVRERGAAARLVALFSVDPRVSLAGADGEQITIQVGAETSTVQVGDQSATVSGPEGTTGLGGAVAAPPPPPKRIVTSERPERIVAGAIRLEHPPALDGTLEGFDRSEPIELADELRYRRSEEPFGPETAVASCYLNWDEQHLYLGLEVTKPEVVVRAADAPPLELDNDPDDIHADGVQVFYRVAGRDLVGYLVRPTDDGGILARPIPGEPTGLVPLGGGSSIGEEGYRLDVALPCAGLEGLPPGSTIEVEIMVNEMRADRIRRAGQLVWSGRGGWVYLRGDRIEPGALGQVELLE